jgi:NAD(P)H-dependent flavin oxidoreductase YrpB (nitropropane dioxygenase family)
MSEQALPTRFTRLVGVRHPVMQEGLGPYKTVRLAAAVATAGGLGTVSIPGISEEASAGAKILRGYIEEACALTDGVLAVNVPVGADKITGKALPFSAAYVRAVVEAVRDPAIAKRLRVITTSAGPPAAARELIAGSGLIHFHKVGGTGQALRAEKDGVDAIIASGYEAGGHTHSRPMHTFVLVPSVTEAVRIPVILAGGARDGRSLAAALAMGADAIAMGTRFVASRDNTDWSPAYAQRILDAREADDIIFSAIYGPSRALPSRGIEELATLTAQGATHDALTRFKDERLIAGQRDGDMEGGILPCGQVAGVIKDLIDVASFIPAMVDEAIRILRQLAPQNADVSTTARPGHG